MKGIRKTACVMKTTFCVIVRQNFISYDNIHVLKTCAFNERRDYAQT